MSARSPVVILGAGLTGLSAAAHLDVPYRVLERSNRVGGLCVTEEDSGYRFDRTGHLLHLRDPSIREWILSLLGDKLLTVRRRSRIWSHGQYTRYPYQANTFGLPPEVAKACLLGFLEARDAENDAEGPPPDNFEKFIYKYMGRGIAEHFMIPYNTKLWGIEPREMSPAWTTRFVPRPTLEEVVSGAVGCNDQELGYNVEFLYPKRGIGVLAEALSASVGPIELEVEPRRIDLDHKQMELSTGELISYDHLISTIPLDSLLSLCEGLPPPIQEKAGKLRCTSLRYLDMALRRPPKLDVHWVYVPEPDRPFYRVGAYSNFSDVLAPPGCGSLYIELASREAPHIESLVPQVTEGLVEMGLIDGEQDIVFVRARHLRHAYVVYDHQYEEATSALHPYLSGHGIISCGRYGTWEYSAMEDALMSGRSAASRVQSTPSDPSVFSVREEQ